MQKRIQLEWDDVRFFLAVRRTGSLTAAGKRLGVNQSTVGRRLAALDAASGSALFLRTPGGYRLTPSGEAIVARAERLEAEALALERALTGVAPGIEGTVRLTTTEGLGTLFLAPALAELRRLQPRLDVELNVDATSLSLSRREADLALRLARPRGASLVARRLASVAYALYASPAYLGERGRPRGADGFAGHDVVGWDEAMLGLPEAQWLSRHAHAAAAVLRTNSVLVQLQAVREGSGLALLPCFLAEGNGLARVARPPVLTRELWLVLHPDLQHVPRVRAVVDFVVARARAWAGRFAGRTGELGRHVPSARQPRGG